MKRSVYTNTIICLLLLAFATKDNIYANTNTGTQQVTFATNKLRDIAKALSVTLNTKDTLFTVNNVSKTAKIKVRYNTEQSVVHIGIDFINNNQRDVIGTALSDFVERTLLETLINSSDQEANLMLREYNVEMKIDGITTKSPQSWVRNLLSSINKTSSVSISKSDKELLLQWTSSTQHIYSFRLIINREAVEGTKKVEAEEIVYKEILMIPQSDFNITSPSAKALVHNTKTDLLVLPGECFIQNTVNTETYYLMSKGTPVAVFDRHFIVESIKNLLQGVVKDNKYQLNIKMNTYEKQNIEKRLALKDFIDYWKHKPDFDVFCGVGTINTKQYEAIVILKNKELQYIHMLRIPFNELIFDNNEMILEGNFITNIPSHNIEQLF